MYLLYSALLAAGLLLSLPYWMLTRRHGKYREGLGERLGKVPSATATQPAPAIWVHAVSVGEVLAVSALGKGVAADASPNTGLWFQPPRPRARSWPKQHFGEDSVFYFPAGFRIRDSTVFRGPAARG